MSELKGLIHSLILGSILLLYSRIEQTLHFMKMCNVTGTKWLWKYAALFQALVPGASAPCSHSHARDGWKDVCSAVQILCFSLHSNLVWNKWVDFVLNRKEQSFSAEMIEFPTDSKWLCVSWKKYNGQMNSSELLLWYVSKTAANCQIFECHKWNQSYWLPFNLPCDLVPASLSMHGSTCSTLMLVFMTLSELTNNMGKGLFKKCSFVPRQRDFT